LIIFQWGIWIFKNPSQIFSSSSLIIFQWGIWIVIASNQRGGLLPLDYLPMRNLNKSSLNWSLSAFVLDYLPMRNLNWATWYSLMHNQLSWLSSNEEFELSALPATDALAIFLIIFQWGIWIYFQLQALKHLLWLDYLPMRNLNLVEEGKLTGPLVLIIFQWGIWISPKI